MGSDDGKQTYPRTNVTFASNHGSYSAIYPEEEVVGVQFASMIDKRVSSLESGLSQTSQTIIENHGYVKDIMEKNSKKSKITFPIFVKT